MPLVAGTRLGPYEIVAALGKGGMGEVYRAHDARLGRTVAIKVLAHELTSDPEAHQRFEREARACAAFAHAHICRLLDIGRQDDTEYLVMEYLDGETLAVRLQRGRLRLTQALTFALQISDALAAAHRAGIVHRDLKPGNIMLTSDGAMLLDFGLARQLPQQAIDDRTATTPAPITRSGTILGTVQYMSPEQLSGRDVNTRTDIFAFGAVLYEMIGGRRAFEGSTEATLIGSILHVDPPSLSSTDALVPTTLDRLVQKCLAKDPADRWPTMAEVRSRLETLDELIRGGSGSRPFEPVATSRSRWPFIAAATAIAIAAAGTVGWRLWRSGRLAVEQAASQAPLQRTTKRMTFEPGLQADPTFSPDGRYIAYASDRGGNFDIWKQSLNGVSVLQVTKSADQDTQPSWSPDGSMIAFRSERNGGGIYIVPADGGEERLLVDHGVHPSWSPDGRTIYFLSEFFTHGSKKLNAVTVDGESPHQVQPDFTSHGDWSWIAPGPTGRISFLGGHRDHETPGPALFTVGDDGHPIASTFAGTALADPLAKQQVFLNRFAWNKTGTALCIEVEGASVPEMWLARVEPGTLRILSAERLTTNVTGEAGATFSPDGASVLLSSQSITDQIWQFSVDAAQHRLTSGRAVTPEDETIGPMLVSPNGRFLTFLGVRNGDTNAVWLKDLQSPSTPPRPLHFLGIWSPDSRSMAFQRFAADGKMSMAIGTPNGESRAISPMQADGPQLTGWTPDGSAVLAQRERGRDIELIEWPATRFATEPSRVVLKVSRVQLSEARYSPDGRWVSFVAYADGRNDVAIAPAAGPPDRPWQRVVAGQPIADKPHWSADGRTLYFLAPRPSAYLNLMSVRIDPDRGSPIGDPVQLSAFDSPSLQVMPEIDKGTLLGVGGGKFFLTMRSRKGSILMIEHADR